MRLLNTQSFNLREFISDGEIPEYAILSHTWEGGEEISLQEWENQTAEPYVRQKKGFAKIERFCVEALCDGFEWVWVDTSVLSTLIVIIYAARSRQVAAAHVDVSMFI